MKNQEIIKKALSYSLGSDLHETWRASRKLANGNFEPRIKKSEDETWNANHGTNQVDIANHSFEELPSNWQYENLQADQMASIIHNEWLKRNNWVFNPNYGNPELAVPFEQLSIEEQDKDRAQLAPAITKVQAYMEGKIDIAAICEKYGLVSNRKVR